MLGASSALRYGITLYTHNFDPLSSQRKTLSYMYSTQPLMLNYYQQNIYRQLIPIQQQLCNQSTSYMGGRFLRPTLESTRGNSREMEWCEKFFLNNFQNIVPHFMPLAWPWTHTFSQTSGKVWIDIYNESCRTKVSCVVSHHFHTTVVQSLTHR